MEEISYSSSTSTQKIQAVKTACTALEKYQVGTPLERGESSMGTDAYFRRKHLNLAQAVEANKW